MINLIVFFSFALLSFQSFTSEAGILNDEKKAIKIAEAYLVTFFGEKVIEERPFKLRDKGESWEVSGTFHCPKGKICKGGVAIIELKKIDGAVVNIDHEK